MNDKVQVGTTTVKFNVTAFNNPMPLATVHVDIPIYANNSDSIGNNKSGYVAAQVPDDFDDKVAHALQVFAKTLQASFEEGERNVDNH